MKINKLILKNYRRFANLEISFESPNANNTTVFIGNNGAGKTAILDALVLNLSWLIARINREKGTGHSIDDNDILNGQASAFIDSTLEHGDEEPYSWQIAKTRKGKESGFKSDLKDVTRLASIFRKQLTENDAAPLPLIVYYPVNRAVVDIPLKIRTRHNFEQIDGYDNALQQGVDFRRFFEWFRDREDVENEQLNYQYQNFLKNNSLESLKTLETFGFIVHEKDKQLNAVRKAIKLFMSDFDNLRVQRRPLQMLIDKNGEHLDVSQLSQGEKCLMSLVGDIARRLAMMNPALENPLDGEGIVLIDEIDMHLHPTWQRSVIGNLNKTFPNCQFILTTHSPIVISETPHLLVYALDDGEISRLNNLYGMDVNHVLLREMDAEIRNVEIQNAFDDLLDTIQDGNVDGAKLRCAELQQKVAVDNLELNKMQLLIKRLEFQRAKNN
jgi:predicted ATP-binding protein involved in virulence